MCVHIATMLYVSVFHEVGLELAIDPPPPGGILYTMIFLNNII